MHLSKSFLVFIRTHIHKNISTRYRSTDFIWQKDNINVTEGHLSNQIRYVIKILFFCMLKLDVQFKKGSISLIIIIQMLQKHLSCKDVCTEHLKHRVCCKSCESQIGEYFWPRLKVIKVTTKKQICPYIFLYFLNLPNWCIKHS